MSFQNLTESQANPEVPINENFETVQVGGVFGKRHVVTDALTWGYYGGIFGANTVADGTVTLTDDDVNYIVVERSTGTVSVSVATTNWDDTTDYARIYQVTTADGAVTDEEDWRLGTGGTHAGASGGSGGSGGSGTKTYAFCTPMTSQPPASNFATLDTRNSIAVLDFDAGTDEAARWVLVMPEAASLGSGLQINIKWAASTATSGTCRWGARIMKLDTDLDTDSFDTAATAGGTANGTSGIPTSTTITLTTIDGVTAGDAYMLEVYRDADGTSGTDDMTGDAELFAVEVRSAA